MSQFAISGRTCANVRSFEHPKFAWSGPRPWQTTTALPPPAFGLLIQWRSSSRLRMSISSCWTSDNCWFESVDDAVGLPFTLLNEL